MADVLLALRRTFADLRYGQVWLYVLTPALFSLLLIVVLAVWALGAIVQHLLGYPPMTWLAAWGLLWAATFLAHLGGWMAILAVAWLGAMLVASVAIMPLMMKFLARGKYRDLAPMGKDSFVAGTVNSVLASLIFIAAWLLTIPLWLIPGFSLLIPLMLMAWLNRRTFAWDALSLHASAGEWAVLHRRHKSRLFLLGLMMALFAHIPLIGLLAPALTALSFGHYSLEALRRERGGALVSINPESGG
jgi:hypothetical protein